MSRSRLLRITLAVLLLAIVISARAYGPTVKGRVATNAKNLSESASVPAPSRDGSYPVVRVVDGDTFVALVDGKETKIRLIGLNTPESVDPRRPVQCFGREAAAEAVRMLRGTSVRLEYDASQGMLDAYGRTLAYAYLPDGTLFNEYMIRAGYGHEYTYRLPYRYQSEFKAAEREARAAQSGLWAPGACALSN